MSKAETVILDGNQLSIEAFAITRSHFKPWQVDMTNTSRRVFSLGAVGGAFCRSAPFSHAEENLKKIYALKPGEFT